MKEKLNRSLSTQEIRVWALKRLRNTASGSRRHWAIVTLNHSISPHQEIIRNKEAEIDDNGLNIKSTE